MYGIYFCLAVRGKGLEVGIHPTLEYSMVFNLYIVALVGVELNFSFEVDVSCSKETVIQISVKGPNGHA